MPNNLKVNEYVYEGSCSLHLNNDGITEMTVFTRTNNTLQAFTLGKDLVVSFSDGVGVWEITCIVYEKRPALIGGWKITLWVKKWSWLYGQSAI